MRLLSAMICWGLILGAARAAEIPASAVAETPKAALPYADDPEIVAVLKQDTFIYDIEKNEWAKLDAKIPFAASDAATVFAYDEGGGVFLLANPRTGQLAAFDPHASAWETVTPKGPGMPKPPYCVGKGYYDPTFNVFVVQSAYQEKMWVYRHKKAE